MMNEETEEFFKLNDNNVEDILDRMMRDDSRVVSNYTELMSESLKS